MKIILSGGDLGGQEVDAWTEGEVKTFEGGYRYIYNGGSIAVFIGMQ